MDGSLKLQMLSDIRHNGRESHYVVIGGFYYPRLLSACSDQVLKYMAKT
jgi:hypothetical protein